MKQSQFNRGIIRVYVWMHWLKPQTTTVRIASIPAKIWTEYIKVYITRALPLYMPAQSLFIIIYDLGFTIQHSPWRISRYSIFEFHFESLISRSVAEISITTLLSFFSSHHILIPLSTFVRSRKLRLTTVGDLPRWPRDTPLSAEVDTKFRRQVTVAQSI
jgi:hypothetical protein